MPAEELWRLYMTLLEAESGFRMLKSSLGLRPNFHQKEDRVDGHVFISVLAYHLLCWARRRLEENGDRREWKTIRRILRTHSLVSTRLPFGGWASHHRAQTERAGRGTGPDLAHPRS